MIGLGFLLIYSAIWTCINIASKIMKDLGFQNLGSICVAIVYFAYTIGSAFGSKIVNRIGIKKTLCLFSIPYSLWVASFLLPAYQVQIKENGE